MSKDLPVFASLSFKNMQSRRTHDGGALSATVYLGKTKIGTFEDEGFGGGGFMSFASADAEKYWNAEVEKQGIREAVYNHSYDFLDSHADLNNSMLVDAYVSEVFNKKEDEKQLKKLNKACLYGIVDQNGFSVGWKKMTLEQIAKDPKGLPFVQRAYDRVVEQLANGVLIINDAKQLAAWGVKVNEVLHVKA